MVDATYMEVSATRAVNNELFGQGMIDIPWSIGYPQVWIPSRSYMRITLQLLKAVGVVPKISDLISYSDNVAGNLYTSCSLKAGGVEISKISSFHQQASMLKQRCNSSHSYLKSIGKDTCLLESSFSKRIQAVSDDYSIGSRLNAITVMFKSVDNVLNANTVSVANNTTTLIGINTKFVRDVSIGDEVVISGISMIVATITDDLNIVLSATYTGTAIVGASDYYFITRDINRSTQGHNVVYALHQPCLGIFDNHEPMGSGDYSLSLNPNVYYKQACVQTFKNNAVSGTDYIINVLDIKFYVYIQKMSIPDSIHTLNMYESNIQNKMYADNLQFTIPSSTQKICVFLQNNDANTNTKFPPSYFGTTDNLDLKVQSIQLSYRGQQKTSTTYQSFFISRDDTNPVPIAGDLRNQLQQRYLETYMALDPESVKTIGCESFDSYLERGAFYAFDFTSDSQTRDTELQVNMILNSDAGTIQTTKVFVVSYYKTLVKYSSKSGAIAQVEIGSI